MRTLKLTSPHMKGQDVLDLQKALHVRTDSEYGSVTANAVKNWKWYFGYHKKYVNQQFTASDHSYMTGLKPKTPLMKIRASRRKPAVPVGQTLRLKALSNMKSWAAAGLIEHPAGSNVQPVLSQLGKSHGVDSWGMGFPWCAYSSMLAALMAGSTSAKQGLVQGQFNALYVPEIDSLARAGKHGLKTVGWKDALPGDFVIFNWDGGVPDHIGMLVSNEVAYAVTVEGNTSADNGGSQSNGGGVFIRHRDRSLIQTIVRWT